MTHLNTFDPDQIVELLAASEEETDPFTDVTSLLMPYYPLGLLDLLQDVSIIPTELHVAANLQATTTMTSIQAYLGIALSIASQLFQALHYLHEKAHIAHRDIKPLNVRLVPIVQDLQPAPSSYVLKLIDFGTATFLDQPQTASHTPSSNTDFRSKTTAVCSGVFRAPELLFSPLDGYDPRGIDIWAGACVISMFLTAFTVVRKEADRRADDEEIFGRGSDDGSEHGEALKLDAEEQSGAVSTRHPTARTDEPKELEATEQQMAPAVILPPSLRRKSLFDLERVSDIPLAANIFELKGLPSDVAEWPVRLWCFPPPLLDLPSELTHSCYE
jgi:serine/threonine protein kinase